MIVRPAQSGDIAAIAAIYAHHVLRSTATFDVDPPDEAHWHERLALLTAKDWPFLVAERGAACVGYAYAAQFRDRPAYVYACENSIYVRPGEEGRGVGTQLLRALVTAAKVAGFRQMIAVIGGAEPASAALHAKLGFVEVGRIRHVGYKFGRLLDTLYMQRSLDQSSRS